MVDRDTSLASVQLSASGYQVESNSWAAMSNNSLEPRAHQGLFEKSAVVSPVGDQLTDAQVETIFKDTLSEPEISSGGRKAIKESLQAMQDSDELVSIFDFVNYLTALEVDPKSIKFKASEFAAFQGRDATTLNIKALVNSVFKSDAGGDGVSAERKTSKRAVAEWVGENSKPPSTQPSNLSDTAEWDIAITIADAASQKDGFKQGEPGYITADEIAKAAGSLFKPVYYDFINNNNVQYLAYWDTAGRLRKSNEFRGDTAVNIVAKLQRFLPEGFGESSTGYTSAEQIARTAGAGATYGETVWWKLTHQGPPLGPAQHDSYLFFVWGKKEKKWVKVRHIEYVKDSWTLHSDDPSRRS